MKAAGRRRNFGNNDNSKSNKDNFKEASSATSDFSDSDDHEKPRGSRRINKSKITTNIVPSFFDEIMREIDESQSVDTTNENVENNKAENDSSDEDSNSQSNQDIITSTSISNIENLAIQDQNHQKTTSSKATLDIDDHVSYFESSSNTKKDFVTSPIIITEKTIKKSIATSPFKPPQENKDQQHISAQPQQPPKKSVTILYNRKPPEAHQRKQQEKELLERAKQQQQEQNVQMNKEKHQQNKQKSKQQLIIIDDQHPEQNIKQQQKSKQNNATIEISNDKTINKQIHQISNDKKSDQNPKQNQRKKIDTKDKKESETVYLPPMYDKKLNSLFDIVSSESDEPFTRDHIYFETSQAEMCDAFVFDIHEEGGRLYLFCKYVADPTQYGTICICVTSPSLFLQFLPAFDVSDEKVEKEIEQISKMCNGEIISKKWLNKRSIYSTLEHKYLEVELSQKFDIANVPIKGKTYEAVYGSTLSSSENFIIRKNLKGAKWISLRCSQASRQQTSIPMYTTTDPYDIEVVKGQIQKPSMNICIFSTFERNGMILMVSMRILYQCNYETLDNYKGLNSAKKSIITFIYAPEVSKAQVKNDRTMMYCSTEAELLMNFAERIEQFDIDIICSYDLINHDLPFIIGRMKANNLKQWSKLSRHIRTVYPKKDNFFSLIASGRMLLDLKSAFKNLLQIESDNLSSLVQTELEIDRPILDFDNGSFCLTDPKQMQKLISFNRKDTQFIKNILDNKNVIALSEHIARITGCQWSQIMSEPPSSVIESLLINHLYKNSFIIPDKKQKSEKFIFSPFKTKTGFYTTPTALVSCQYFTPKIIRYNNLCFTTIDQLRSQKSNSVFPVVISELLNSLKKLSQMEDGAESSQASLLQKNLYKKSLIIILNMIKPYFEYGSQRFPIKALGQLIDDEIHQIIESFGENIISVSGKNDYDSILIKYEDNSIDDKNDGGELNAKDDEDEIDELIAQANVRYKHFEFKVSEKYTRLLVSNRIAKQTPFYNLTSFLGICKNDERKPHNFNFYRYDWCTATKILIYNAFLIIMSSSEAENDLVYLIKEFPDTSKLEITDFAITAFPPNAQVVALNQEKIKRQKRNKSQKIINLNRNKPVLRRVIDNSDSDNENNHQPRRKFLTSTSEDFDYDDLEIEDDDMIDKDYISKENCELIELNSQLVKIMSDYEEKGKFVNIEGKISYIRCLNNTIKSVENVKSIEGEIDIDWYKKNQFFDAMKLSMKPFSNIISEHKIYEAFFGDSVFYDYYEINRDDIINNIKLFFKCFNCNQKNVFTGINNKSLKCQNCGIRFSWKFVANSLNISINKLFERITKNEFKCSFNLCKQKTEQLNMTDCDSHIDPCNPTRNCSGEFALEFSPKEIYDIFLSLEDLFDKELSDCMYKDDDDDENHDEDDEKEKELNDEINKLTSYMKKFILRFKHMHSFNNVRLSTLLSTQTQPSDTQIINDVCSFLDDE